MVYRVMAYRGMVHGVMASTSAHFRAAVPPPSRPLPPPAHPLPSAATALLSPSPRPRTWPAVPAQIVKPPIGKALPVSNTLDSAYDEYVATNATKVLPLLNSGGGSCRFLRGLCLIPGSGRFDENNRLNVCRNDGRPDGMSNEVSDAMPDGTFDDLQPSLLRLFMLYSFKCRLRLPSLPCHCVRTCAHGHAQRHPKRFTQAVLNRTQRVCTPCY